MSGSLPDIQGIQTPWPKPWETTKEIHLKVIWISVNDFEMTVINIFKYQLQEELETIGKGKNWNSSNYKYDKLRLNGWVE